MRTIFTETIITVNEHGTITAQLYEAIPSRGDICRISEDYSASGLVKCVSTEKINLTRDWKGGNVSREFYWWIDLIPHHEPEDPCDSAFMEEISS